MRDVGVGEEGTSANRLWDLNLRSRRGLGGQPWTLPAHPLGGVGWGSGVAVVGGGGSGAGFQVGCEIKLFLEECS